MLGFGGLHSVFAAFSGLVCGFKAQNYLRQVVS